MALDYESDNITNDRYSPAAAPHSAREVYRGIGAVVTDNAIANGDLIGLIVLPANCVPTGITVVCVQAASDGTMEIDVGILNSDKDDLVTGSLLIDGSGACGTAVIDTVTMNVHQCVFGSSAWLEDADCPGYVDADTPHIPIEKIVAVKVTGVVATAQTHGFYAVVDYRSAENGI